MYLHRKHRYNLTRGVTISLGVTDGITNTAFGIIIVKASTYKFYFPDGFVIFSVIFICCHTLPHGVHIRGLSHVSWICRLHWHIEPPFL